MTTKGGTPRPDPRLPVAIALVVGLIALAVALEPIRTDLVASGPLYPSDGVGLDELIFAAVTSLGAGPGLVVLVSLVAIVLARAGRVADAVFVVTAVAGGSLITRVVKDVYRAPRPPTVDQASHLATAIPGEVVIAVVTVGLVLGLMRGGGLRVLAAGTIVLIVLLLERATDRLVPIARGLDSYPSGHATSAAALAAAVIVVTVGDGRWRVPVAIVATAVAFGIGLSRMYLGVHYPIDVIGGWCVGVAWVVVWWLIWAAVRRRWSATDHVATGIVD
jgi:membrane-associated phospholipid phosphatase